MKRIKPLWSIDPYPQWLKLIEKDPQAYPTFYIQNRPPRKTFPEDYAKVRDAFLEFKRSFRWVPDLNGDVWGSGYHKPGPLTGKPILYGDCDDFVYELQYKIRNLPLSTLRCLRWVTCKKKYGHSHMVLAIEFKEGTYIADNSKLCILPIDHDQFGDYTWLACTVPGRFPGRAWSPFILEDVT